MAERGDWDELRARAGAGDWPAARRLAEHLAEHGDLDQAEQIRDRATQVLRARADELRADWGPLTWDEVWARADALDIFAESRLAEVLAERGEWDELRARADSGNGPATRLLAEVLAERGEWDELRAQVDAADGGSAAKPLIELLTRRGRGEEAERLRRFGFNPDGSIART